MDLTYMNEIERINLDDYIQVGEGGTAVAYAQKNGTTLARLFNPGIAADRAKEEFLAARTVFELGIPTPEPYRLLTDGKRFGAEYELIKGKRSFSRIISQEPERLQEISQTFARMAKQLHAMQADTTRLKSMKEKVRRFYLERNAVPEDYKQKALQFIEQVPETTTCLHGDLQIGNVITDGKRTLWIDVGDFSYGVPEWDLGMLWMMTNTMRADRADFIFHLTPKTLNAHWNIFFPAYLGTSDPQRIDEATRRILPFAAAKIPFMFSMATYARITKELCENLIKLFE